MLRPLGLADLGPLHEIYADREVMRYIGSGDSHSESVDETERRLQGLMNHQDEHGFSLWAVTDRANGTVMGYAGLIHYAHRGPEIELAYRLAKPYWGKGYATEAARGWLRYGFDELGLDRIVAVTHPENVASQRVLEKVGMRYERMAIHDGVRVRLYAIERGS